GLSLRQEFSALPSHNCHGGGRSGTEKMGQNRSWSSCSKSSLAVRRRTLLLRANLHCSVLIYLPEPLATVGVKGSHETAQVHHPPRRRGCRVAAGGEDAAAGRAGDRLSFQPARGRLDRDQQGPE